MPAVRGKLRIPISRYTLEFMSSKRVPRRAAGSDSISPSTKRWQQIHPPLAYAASHLEQDVPLAELAEHSGLSPFHLQRAFTAALGESPKQFALRLRLSRAATLLLTSRDTILDIALTCGFQNHETFSRAFRRRFGLSPREYRRRGFAEPVTPSQRDQHARLIDPIARCVGLYHVPLQIDRKEPHMHYSITKETLAAQPVLLMQRRIKRSEIAATIGECLGQIFGYAQQHAIPLSGFPLTRYSNMSAGLMTIEPAMRIAVPGQETVDVQPDWVRDAAGAGVKIETLPGGPAATTLHTGPYDTLQDAYAALEQWIEQQGLKPGGDPWECYLTDPTDHPDPKDWKTKVVWPLAG